MTRPIPQLVATRLLAAAFLTLTATTTLAQTTPAISRNIVVLDPAHGGSDNGAPITPSLLEKQFNLAFAARLRPLLAAAGFTVVTTRDADPTTATPLTPDMRAVTANRVHALACILIHATTNGAGAHIVTSALQPSDEPATQNSDQPAAQIPYLPLSLRFANQLGLALDHVNIPTTLSHAAIRPIDNLTCPAVAFELAPNPGAPLTDANYQLHAAQAITAALVTWRNLQPPAPKPPPPPPPAVTPAPTPAPTPTPTPEGPPQ